MSSNEGIPQGFKLRYTLRGHESEINRIAWSPDGRLLVSSSFDKTVRIRDTQTRELVHTLTGHVWALTLGLCLLFLSGCGGQSNAQTTNPLITPIITPITNPIINPTIIQTTHPTIKMTESQNGQSIQAHVGNTIVLQLDENPSTGYLWAISKTDPTILALQDSTYTASKTSL
jgi:WD40 repeat protein